MGGSDGSTGNPGRNESAETAANDTDDNATDDTDEALTEEEIVILFEEILNEEGLETETVERADDVLEVEYLATGDTDQAAATEVEIVADVYARAIDAGLTTDRLDAFVRDPEADLILDTYNIETEWTEAFLNEEIEWEEYFERIVETFEATEAAKEEDMTEDEIVELFLSTLAEEGIETTAVEQTSDELSVTYFATGTDDDRDLEIEVIADAYADAVAEGLTFDRLILTRRDPEDGTDLDTFTIETTWTESYLNDELTWEEYVGRIDETVESIEQEESKQDDSDQEDSDEDDSTESEEEDESADDDDSAETEDENESAESESEDSADNESSQEESTEEVSEQNESTQESSQEVSEQDESTQESTQEESNQTDSNQEETTQTENDAVEQNKTAQDSNESD